MYLDAGLRVFGAIKHLMDIDCTNSIYAPDDAPLYDTQKRFGGIIDISSNIDASEALFKEYHIGIVNERYFLNCIWMYDTTILELNLFDEMVTAMNKFPICRCNEMTIMNLILTYKYKLWKPMQLFVDDKNTNIRLFGWTEHDRDYGYNVTWRNFCFLKYPTTINFECG